MSRDGGIAGITVEIGGDTTKLSKALSGINKEIKETQTALKDVNKLLKIDPGNTELLRQKQNDLKNAIQETKDKLKSLQDAAKNSDLEAAEHDALQREIFDTKQQLKSLETEYRNSGSGAAWHASWPLSVFAAKSHPYLCPSAGLHDSPTVGRPESE